MSGGARICSGYSNVREEPVASFECPRATDGGDEAYCCGFSDFKYCCNEAGNYFPYPHGYMWSLSIGAMVGLGVAALLLLIFIFTVFVMCCLYLYNKPQQLDSGLKLQNLATSPKQMGKKESKQRSLETTQRSSPSETPPPVTNRIGEGALVATTVETEIAAIKLS